MNEKKKNIHTLSRKQPLQRCKQVETGVFESMSEKRLHPLPSSKSEEIEPRATPHFPDPDLVKKVREWITPIKTPRLKSNFTEKESSNVVQLKNVASTQRSQKAPIDVKRNPEKNIGVKVERAKKESGEPLDPLSMANRHFWTWGALKKDLGKDLQLGDTGAKANIHLQNKECKEEAEVSGVEPKASEEDAEKLKKIIAKEKRLELMQARLQWERDNEIREKPQKPKDTQGDMFYIPVPENKTKPEEFKNNYNKYIVNFEEKFRKKLAEKNERIQHKEPARRSGDKSGRPSKDILNDAFYRILAARY